MVDDDASIPLSRARDDEGFGDGSAYPIISPRI